MESQSGRVLCFFEALQRNMGRRSKLRSEEIRDNVKVAMSHPN